MRLLLLTLLLPATALALGEPTSDQRVIEGGWYGQPAIVADPFVWRDSEGTHLLYTTHFCRNTQGIYHYFWAGGACTDNMTTFAYGFSTDEGLTWSYRVTPALWLDGEPWRNEGLETAHVLRAGDALLLTYSATGVGLENRFSIGSAVLQLGGRTVRTALMDESTTFTHHPNPLVPKNVTIDGDPDNNTQEPSVTYLNGKLQVWYIGLGVQHADQGIGASNPITSVHMRLAEFDGATGTLLGKTTLPVTNVNITEMHLFDGLLQLFATTLEGTGGPHQGERIALRTSPDAQQWSAQQILVSPDQPYKSWGVMAPTVVEKPSEVIVFYTAWEHGACNLPSRIGFPINAEQTECIFGNLGRATFPR